MYMRTVDNLDTNELGNNTLLVDTKVSEEVTIKKKRYLLILSCSKRKKQISEAPALELYDGPFYCVLRKGMPPNLDVLILSARYGLIDSNKIISYYDQKMNIERAKELSEDVEVKLREKIETIQYKNIFVNLGKTYMVALKDSEKLLKKYNVTFAAGSIGKRLHQLKNWLAKIGKEQSGL